MLKKLFFLTLMICSITPHVVAMQEGSTSSLNHIKAQMFAIKRAYNTARIRIKIANKALKNTPELYQKLKSTIEKLLTDARFTTPFDKLVTDQYAAIVQNNGAFAPLTTELKLSSLFPNITVHPLAQELFSAMAGKAYYLELGKKLAQKMQELQPTPLSKQTQ
jgi:hypothetical protein